jgi:hypothetical protein
MRRELRVLGLGMAWKTVFRGFGMLLCLAVIAATPLTRAIAGDNQTGVGGNGDNPYAIGLWGDLPYSTAQATTGIPNLIADMNSQNLSFTVHDGDLKSGSGPCPDSIYTQALGYFNSLQAPAIFTPGDNDWVDCDRAPGINSLAQLDLERQLFFSTPYTLGGHPFLQEVQSTPLCLGVGGPRPCVENRRWTVGRVTYATLNIQGSCNTCATLPQIQRSTLLATRRTSRGCARHSPPPTPTILLPSCLFRRLIQRSTRRSESPTTHEIQRPWFRTAHFQMDLKTSCRLYALR